MRGLHRHAASPPGWPSGSRALRARDRDPVVRRSRRSPGTWSAFGIVALVFGRGERDDRAGREGPVAAASTCVLDGALQDRREHGPLPGRGLRLQTRSAARIKIGDFPPDILTQATLVAAALGSLVVGLVSALVRLVVTD